MASDRTRERSAYGANAFLRTLTAGDAALITPLLTEINCRTGERLAMSDAPGSVIYFPLTLVASLGLGEDGGGLGMIGREGLIGWSAVLGSGQAEHAARVLFDGGTALVLPVKRMRLACFASPTMALSVLRFVQSYTVQLSCMIQANGCATLKQRLSAWLLKLHDRIDGDTIRITHQALAIQLQVRRASVTDLLHLLEADLAVRCDRCSIQVRDRDLLELCAGAAYGRTEESYRRSIGPFGKGTLAPTSELTYPALLPH